MSSATTTDLQQIVLQTDTQLLFYEWSSCKFNTYGYGM